MLSLFRQWLRSCALCAIVANLLNAQHNLCYAPCCTLQYINHLLTYLNQTETEPSCGFSFLKNRNRTECLKTKTVTALLITHRRWVDILILSDIVIISYWRFIYGFFPTYRYWQRRCQPTSCTCMLRNVAHRVRLNCLS